MSFTYLQEQGEESSAECFLDIPASVLSRLNLIPDPSCSSVSATGSCRVSRSGTMSAPSTAGPGEDLSMSCAEGSPARTSAQPGRGPESPVNDLASGPRWLGSLARYDPDTRSWRTAQCSLFGGLESFSGIWPRWGMMHDGECSELSTLAPRTDGNESGLWPTPVKYEDRAAAYTIETSFRHYVERRQTHLAQWVRDPRMFPTPTKQERASNQPYDATAPIDSGRSLSTFVRTFPTPTTCMNKGSSPASLTRKDGRNRENDRLDHAIMAQNGGQLNPTWVEWLMGWPLGWTDLRLLEMVRFRQWLRSHGGCYPALDAGPGL